MIKKKKSSNNNNNDGKDLQTRQNMTNVEKMSKYIRLPIEIKITCN